MTNKVTDKLLHEFRGEGNCFLISIRCDLEWSHNKFINLLNSMRDYCKQMQSSDPLDKEITQGFWFVSWYIKDWTSHSNFRNINKFSEEYYSQSYELICDLSYWYFMNEPIFVEEEYFKLEINILEGYVNKD
ncbi:hypothetical protein [Clostridium drakei]|uniref:Uncharacterized protein n=1 Tax=Clostridium drakei TaxID=332101 RepID=A0A2U8DPX9_9CLOT|nr:hypothetical protein [Clostridium drakei]AWI04658.1 hypothetical protein B9W14_09190 [Clostridium drakei]